MSDKSEQAETAGRKLIGEEVDPHPNFTHAKEKTLKGLHAVKDYASEKLGSMFGSHPKHDGANEENALGKPESKSSQTEKNA